MMPIAGTMRFYTDCTLNIKLLKRFVPTIPQHVYYSDWQGRLRNIATLNGLKINSSEHFEIIYTCRG